MKRTFKDHFGTSQIEPEQTINFVKSWFHPDDEVLIVLIPTSSDKRGIISLTLTARQLAEANVPAIESLAHYDSGLYNIYFGVSPLIENHKVTAKSRGGKADVKAVYGVWADLDVKPGAFGSRDEIYHYLDSLNLQPSLVVENGGTGGVHAYWKLDKPEPATTNLPSHWWAYLVEKAYGRDIDHLADSSRVMRLPGAVYYPKNASGLSGTVKVVANTGAIYSRSQIEELSAGAYQRVQARKAEIRARNNERMNVLPEAAMGVLKQSGNQTWTTRIARLALEDKINAMDWADILEPAGWTYLREEDQGKRQWARPGSTSKSGNTDWQGSGVLSLHSWSEDTGLADLKLAGIPLTKEIVLLRLRYNDDVTAMVTDLLN